MPNQRPEAVSAAIDYMGEIARREVRGNHAEEHWDVLLPYIRTLEADNARKTEALDYGIKVLTLYILAYIAVAGAVRIGFWTAGIDFGERGVEAGFAYFMSLICGALGIAAVQVAEEA